MKQIIYIFFFLVLGTIAHAQSYKIIVNNSNSISSLTSAEASKLFLKKTKKWSDGQKATPIDLSSKFAVREEFSKGVHRKSISAIKSYWQQYVFSGKGTPPIEKKSYAEVLEYIKNTPGAIGYVPNNVATNGVKVVNLN